MHFDVIETCCDVRIGRKRRRMAYVICPGFTSTVLSVSTFSRSPPSSKVNSVKKEKDQLMEHAQALRNMLNEAIASSSSRIKMFKIHSRHGQ